MKPIFKTTLLFCILIPFASLAQQKDITGLWKGTLYNDTTQRYYRYEVGISKEKKGYSGFSHTWFIIGDTQYFGVKKVKIDIAKDGKILIEDNGLIAHNYPIPPNKGVRQLNVLTLFADSIMILEGPFSTNRTKEYHPLTGSIHLERKNDFWQSSLVPHLQELGKETELSFVKEEKDTQEKEANILALKIAAEQKAEKNSIARAEKEQKDKLKEEEQERNKEQAERLSKEKKIAKNEIKKQSQEVRDIKKQRASEISIAKETKITQAAKQQPETKKEPAADIEKRTTIVQQTVSFTSDSLQLSLYDNGEIDGDTVSVLMNGQLIFAKQGLSTNAAKKTIYIPANTNRVELLMYAETLGTIPPNTGLLVVKDGAQLFELRFSGDYQKNASIVFTRKKE